MRTKDDVERCNRLRAEVIALGRNPDDYKYDLGTQNAYRIEHTKLGSYAYMLINDKEHGKEARVDLKDFYEKRCFSFRWVRLSTDPLKDYPHTTIYDSTGKPVNLTLHALIMGKETGMVIDHNDGDHYNASRSNLNHVTVAQNNQNKHSNVRTNRYAHKSVSIKYVPLLA